jgi:hypothetical protein
MQQEGGCGNDKVFFSFISLLSPLTGRKPVPLWHTTTQHWHACCDHVMHSLAANLEAHNDPPQLKGLVILYK